LRGLLSPLPPEPQKRGKRVSGNPAAVPLPPGGRLRICAIFIVSAANFAQTYNFAYQKGIFYLNQFALVTEFLQTFSIKYSLLLFKV
jgi:hypothetical protein